jgi:hypothetical protein
MVSGSRGRHPTFLVLEEPLHSQNDNNQISSQVHLVRHLVILSRDYSKACSRPNLSKTLINAHTLLLLPLVHTLPCIIRHHLGFLRTSAETLVQDLVSVQRIPPTSHATELDRPVKVGLAMALAIMLPLVETVAADRHDLVDIGLQDGLDMTLRPN